MNTYICPQCGTDRLGYGRCELCGTITTKRGELHRWEDELSVPINDVPEDKK